MENTENRTTLFNYFGEQALLREKKTVFFCPFNVTDTVFDFIRQWIRTLVPGRDCVVCGNSTGVERYTLRLLLHKKISVILPLATVIPQCLEELNIGWKLTEQESVEMLDEALAERRLLMVASTENVSVSVPTKRTMILRNYWMRWVGDRFVVACQDERDYFAHLLWKRPFEVLDNHVTEEKEKEPVVQQVCDDDYDYLLAV